MGGIDGYSYSYSKLFIHEKNLQHNEIKFMGWDEKDGWVGWIALMDWWDEWVG